MSIAQQPGSHRAPDPITRLRWALAATGLALVIVVTLLAGTLQALRRQRQAGLAALSRPASVPAAAVHHLKTARSGAAGSGRGAHRAGAGRHRRPEVEIVERPVIVSPSPTSAPPAQPAQPASARREARPLAARSSGLQQQPSPSPTPVARSLPPAEEPPPVIPPTEEAGRPDTASDSPPEPIARPAAVYPEDAVAGGVTGSVRLKVVVSRRGRVEDTIVVRSSGDVRLDRAAEAAVRRWRYRPARRAGRAVTAVDYVVVDFSRAPEDRPDE